MMILWLEKSFMYGPSSSRCIYLVTCFLFKRFEDGRPNFGRQGPSGGLIYLRCTVQEGGRGGGYP